jgi:hypothetical protein
MSTATGYIRLDDPIPDEQIDAIRSMGNNALIMRLMFTVNHLSRWLTPIHDDDKLDRAVHRGEPTAKDLVVRLREYDEWIYPRLYLAAHKPGANFDVLDDPSLAPIRHVYDKRDTTTVVLMSGFRRSRQSITALLRALPDGAWDLGGRSAKGVEGTIRSMAEATAMHDYRVLRALDQTLDQTGAREGLAAVQTVHLDELLKLVPEHVHLEG